MVLPAGFALPPLPYTLGLLAGIAAVGGLLLRTRPTVTQRVALALVPWMIAGSALHALYQLETAPPAVMPLLGAPAVYATTAIVAGTVWLAVDRNNWDTARILGGAGGGAFLVVAVLVAATGGRIHPTWPLVGLVVAAGLAAAVWILLQSLRPADVRATHWLGGLVVFAHALDGVSTAIGVDVLGFGERTPASRAILDIAALLPTADFIGVGWLFVLVKVAVAVLVVHLFAGYVRESPSEGALLLAGVAAVGLGPGAHNLLLYLVR